MKKFIAFTSLICFGLFFSSEILAQSVSEIKFEVGNHYSLTTDKNLVSVSTDIATKQANRDGIYFTLMVKNNSVKTITIKNVAERLCVSLINERGNNIAILNNAIMMIKRGDPRWRYRSETIIPGSVYINGKEDKRDIKTQEYIQIPANGNWKIGLLIKNVNVETSTGVQGEITTLASGKYKLILTLEIYSNEQNKSAGFVAGFRTPFIDIDYTK